MKRRLRKKKRLGGFKEIGFELPADLRPGLVGTKLDDFVDRLIDLVETRKLSFGGGAGRYDKIDGFVMRRIGRGSGTEDDPAAFAAFLEGDADVIRYEVGAMKDAWR